MVNRNPVKQWFITFPQWNNYDDIKTFEKISPKSTWGYVVKESHENGGIHYHLMLKLGKGTTKSKMLEYWKKEFPNDYKRIDVEGVKDFRAAYRYLQKEKLEEYEWGQGMKLPVWLQAIKDEWDAMKDEVERNERIRYQHHLNRLEEIHEHEHWLLWCKSCSAYQDTIRPCRWHEEQIINVQL